VPTATPSPTPRPAVRWLAFDSDRTGNSEIYLVDVLSGELVNLTRNPAEDRAPAWAPDGASLAFESNRGGNWDVYTLDLVSGELTRLTSDPHFDGSPAWSPDGSQLAFESYRDGNLEIYGLTLASGEVRRLTDDPAGDYGPAWSPNGRWIAFTSWRDGQKEVYLVDAAGGVPVNLTQDPADDQDPAWSHDGSWLAFVSWRDVDAQTGNRNAEVYRLAVMPGRSQPAGGTAERLTDNPWPDLDPALDAEGRLVWAAYEPGEAFETYDPYRPGAFRVWRFDPETGQREPISPAAEGPIADALPDDRRPASSLAGQDVSALAVEPLPPVPPTPQAAPTITSGTLNAFVPVAGVVTTYDGQEILLNDRVVGSFAAWAEAVRQATGYDYMYLTLGSWRPIDAGERYDDFQYNYAYLSWHKAGRAVDLALEYKGTDGEQKMVLAREDLGQDLFWRIYLKSAQQDGSQGRPLREWPWQFWWQILEAEDPTAYAAGGRRRPIPAGYFVDVTALGKRFGWHRIASYRRVGEYHWHQHSRGTEYWHYERTDGLVWLDAMRQVYPEAELDRHFRWEVGLTKFQSPDMMRSKGIQPGDSGP
jgi:TolB protein